MEHREQSVATREAPAIAPRADLRVLQANERTLLAWIRTGVALVAFGFVVARVGVWLRGEITSSSSGAPSSGWIGSAFVLLGTASNAAATLRYLRIRRAIIEGREVQPGNAVVLFLASCVIVLSGALAAYLAL
jgi:putative membrane protein